MSEMVDVKETVVDNNITRLLLLNKKLIMQAKHYGYQGVLEETLRQVEATLFTVTGEEIVVESKTIIP